MATTIQIKRSANVAAPTTTDLLEGELAYSYDKSNNGDLAKLYIEVQDSSGNESIHTIGGKYYTSKVDAATSANTVSTIVSRDALGNFTANTITANNFVGNITASQANKLTTARYINLSGDLQGNVLFDGTQDVTIVANVINNSVALGTDTTGDYVANLTAGSGITLTNDGGESANVTVALSTSGVTANTYGGTTNIPILNIDQFGRVTSASNAAISTSFSLAANSGTTDTFNSGDTLRITGSTGINTVVSDNTISVFNTGVTSLSGTANQIAVSASNASVTLSLPDDVIVNNNLTVQGNLFIRGTATTLQTTTVSINDPLVKFGNANPSDSLDIGFFGEYVKSGNVNYAGIYRDHIDGKFRIFNDSSINPTGNIINTSDTGYSIASLVANLTGGTISGLTANIAVGDGGTGRGTFTTNGILFGNATGALKVTAAGTYGQVLQASADGTPVYGGIDGGVY
jgi:hypothetical protein